MNQLALLFLGVLAAVASSFYGLLVLPQIQVGRVQATKIEETGFYYPSPRNGAAQAGSEVYRSHGCVECHTQQVRPKGLGPDYSRGWGKRRTIAEDYILDSPVQLGSIRLGPDLTNIGRRQPSAVDQLKHLYNPRLLVPDSMMPQYPFLFEKRSLAAGSKPSSDALPGLGEGLFEVVPKPEALALVAYLQTLNSEAPLYSAPFPIEKTNAPAAKVAASVK